VRLTRRQRVIRSVVIDELRAGRLPAALQLVEDHALPIDHTLRHEAAQACLASLRRHMHWVIPAFVRTFGLRQDPVLVAFARQLIHSAVRCGRPYVASAASQAFGLPLDPETQAAITAAREAGRAAPDGRVVLLHDEGTDYGFDLAELDEAP